MAHLNETWTCFHSACADRVPGCPPALSVVTTSGSRVIRHLQRRLKDCEASQALQFRLWSRKHVHDTAGPQRPQGTLVIWNRVEARLMLFSLLKCFTLPLHILLRLKITCKVKYVL